MRSKHSVGLVRCGRVHPEFSCFFVRSCRFGPVLSDWSVGRNVGLHLKVNHRECSVEVKPRHIELGPNRGRLNSGADADNQLNEQRKPIREN